MNFTLDRNKPLYNVACLLATAAGIDAYSWQYYFSLDQRYRDLARWFWSNISPVHDPKKKAILDRVNAAQGVDLVEWYWTCQSI